MSTHDQRLALLSQRPIRRALKRAWVDSKAGTADAHEEGGFILRSPSRRVSVKRWPTGKQANIEVPAHEGCEVDRKGIIATFHTHPNVRAEYLQGPSLTDIRAVRDDPDLKGMSYWGELVISQELLYWITPDGSVVELGSFSLLEALV